MNILKRPMFFAAVVCCITAALALYVKTVAYVFVAISILLISILVFYKKYKYLTVLLSVLIFTVSLLCQFAQIKDINNATNKYVNDKFLVVSEVETYDGFNTLTLKTIRAGVLPKNTKCFVFDYKKTELAIGDVVTANIKISAISNTDKYYFKNYGNGVYATANAEEISKTSNSNIFYKMAGNTRIYIKNTISSIFDGEVSGLLLALITGDKSLLSDQFLETVKTTGISHVIVVSGMHLSIIMMAVFWAIDRLFYNKYLRSFLSIGVVLFIYIVCGFTMSITRAGAMFIVSAIAPIFNRDNDSLSSLLTAITAVLIGSPFAIFNVSFLLSVLSTLAIIWVVPFYYKHIIERFKLNSKILKTILNIILCSVFSVIFTLPVTIKTFGFVSVVSPITNLLITYPITFVLIISVIAISIFALPFIKILGYFAFSFSGFCAKLIIFIVNTINELPITVAVLPKTSFWWSILFIFVVVGFMYFCDFKNRRSDFDANSIRRRTSS